MTPAEIIKCQESLFTLLGNQDETLSSYVPWAALKAQHMYVQLYIQGYTVFQSTGRGVGGRVLARRFIL